MSIALHMYFCNITNNINLNYHVVVNKHMLTCRQLFKILGNKHVVHKVDIVVLWYVEHRLLYKIRTVGQNIQTSIKAIILRIIGREGYFIASFAINFNGVGYEISVKHNTLA